MVDHDDYVGVLVLLDEGVDLVLVLELQLEHVDDWFLALGQVDLELLAEYAAVHCVVQGFLDED